MHTHVLCESSATPSIMHSPPHICMIFASPPNEIPQLFLTKMETQMVSAAQFMNCWTSLHAECSSHIIQGAMREWVQECVWKCVHEWLQRWVRERLMQWIWECLWECVLEVASCGMRYLIYNMIFIYQFSNEPRKQLAGRVWQAMWGSDRNLCRPPK